MKYHVLYRGPLSSCNYGCTYCPFAKRTETHADLEGDRQALAHFLDWVARERQDQFGILFTPWGEALIRRWYQDALVFLTQQTQVSRAAIQTNLSCDLAWLDRCQKERLALWATYHPTQTEQTKFVARVREVHRRGVRLSVGVVGLREHFAAIAQLREEIPPEVYLWVNAYKRQADYYQEEDLRFLVHLDPHFATNNQYHPSQGKACGAGQTSFTVDGQGLIRRCHFVAEPLGSIHQTDWRTCLRERPCPKTSCGCYIGYVHLKPLQQEKIYGEGLLERIPLQ